MKKILYLLVILFIFSVINVYAVQYIGDVDNNGKINSLDYILIRKYILGVITLDENAIIRANINKDNKVNPADYILLRKMILNNDSLVPIKLDNTMVITENQSWSTNYSEAEQEKKIIEATKAVGNVSYTISSQPTGNYFTNSGSTLKMKANTPVGTYSIKIKVEAQGNNNYNSKSLEITMKVTVNEPLYIITEDSKYSNSEYKEISRYNSATLKYRLLNYTYNHHQNTFILVYVENPLVQLNSALATPDALHSTDAETILNNEIKNYGYQNKGLVAVNASFYRPTNNVDGTPWDGVVISHGKIVKNTGNSAIVIGINHDNTLKMYYPQSASNIFSDGVKNSFVVSNKASAHSAGEYAERTQICQLDKHNFVILSGSYLQVKEGGELIKNITGCKETYNLDGGGSRKIYTKDSSPNIKKEYGGIRIIPDMLYFVEK